MVAVRSAQETSSATECSPSFFIRLARCFSTVLMEMHSASEISRFFMPWATRSKISPLPFGKALNIFGAGDIHIDVLILEHFRRHVEPVTHNGPKCFRKTLLIRVFQEIPVGPGLEGEVDEMFVFVSGEHQNLDLRSGLLDALGGFYAVQFGHAQIHKHDVRPHIQGLCNSLIPVPGLGTDNQIIERRQKPDKPFANQRMVIRNNKRSKLFHIPSADHFILASHNNS